MPDRETLKTTTMSAAEKHRRYLFPCVTTYYEQPLTLVRGEGLHVWDDAGRKYLDCFGGVLTVSIGHCHPEVTEAIVRQAQTLVHTSTLYANPALSDLAEAIAGVLPGDLKRIFLSNSGTEADETAVLLEDGEVARAALYVLASVVLSLLAVFVGFAAAGRRLTGG